MDHSGLVNKDLSSRDIVFAASDFCRWARNWKLTTGRSAEGSCSLLTRNLVNYLAILSVNEKHSIQLARGMKPSLFQIEDLMIRQIIRR